MNIKKMMTAGTIAPVLALGLVAPFAFANDHEQGTQQGRVNLTEDQREELKAAFEAGDYNAFQDAVEGTRLESVTEDQFDQRADKFEKKQAVREAIEDGDYDEFRSLVGDEKATEVTSSNFYLLTNMHEARESGDEDEISEAREALKDAGIKKPGKGHQGHKGQKGNQDGERGERPDFSNLSDEERAELKAERQERKESGEGNEGRGGFFNRNN